MKLVYLAGAVPKGQENKINFQDWRKEFENIFEEIRKNWFPWFTDETIFLDPNTGGIELFPLEVWFGRDIHMIYKSDVVVVEWQSKIWLGTAQEMLIAKYYNKPVIAISPLNSHHNKYISTPNNERFHYIHPFLSNTADMIVSDYVEASNVLLNLFIWKINIAVKNINIIEEMRKLFEDKYLYKDEYFCEKLKLD